MQGGFGLIRENAPRKVDTYVYMQMVQELLKEGKEVPLVITGNSMSPFLIHERDQILISRVNRPLKKGDMAFFRRTNGQYIMHRICRVKKENNKEAYYFVGDAQTAIEGPIRREQIFGLITAVERKGKILRKGDFWWEFFEHVWLHIIPFRRMICRIYTAVSSLLRKR